MRQAGLCGWWRKCGLGPASGGLEGWAPLLLVSGPGPGRVCLWGWGGQCSYTQRPQEGADTPAARTPGCAVQYVPTIGCLNLTIIALSCTVFVEKRGGASLTTCWQFALFWARSHVPRDPAALGSHEFHCGPALVSGHQDLLTVVTDAVLGEGGADPQLHELQRGRDALTTGLASGVGSVTLEGS